MDKKEVKHEIDSLIKKIREHSTSMSDIENISDADMSTLIADVEKLYRQIAVLNYLKSHSSKIVMPEESAIVRAAIEKDEVSSTPETTQVNLFGEKLEAASEKPKEEKKSVKKEVKKSVTNKTSKPKLDNLTTAIGLNDKFLFANQLFEGSMSEYNVAIHQLNTAGSIESAMEYIESLQTVYNWDFEEETVKRLIELVDRRYASP